MATLQCSRCGGTRYDTSHRCEKGCGVMTATNEATLATLDGLRKRLEQVEAERDALAAHVESLNSKLDEINESLYGQNLMIAGWHLNGDVEPMDTWFEENNWGSEPATTTSLARRDARMKAEALDDAADVIDRVGADYPQGFLRGRAAKIRQQAEGGGDE